MTRATLVYLCVVSALLLVGLSGCGDDAGAGSVEVQCTRSSDCADPHALCVEGKCEVECVADRDCPSDQRCEAGGCVSDDPPCRADAECRYGEQCVQGICEVIDGFCQRSSECASGFECDGQTLRCVPVGAGSCTTERDCFAYELCVEGRCQSTRDVGPDVDDAGPEDASVEDADTGDPRDTAADAPPIDAPVDVAPVDVEEDITKDVAVDVAVDVAPDSPQDVATDAPDPTDAQQDVAADLSADVGDEEVSGPPPTPGRGIYTYAMLPIGGLGEALAVEFHPSGRFAVVIESTNTVHVVDWASGLDTLLDMTPTSGTIYWDDLAFDPSGDFALLVGTHRTDSSDEGVIFRFDTSEYEAPTGGDILTEFVAARRGEEYVGIEYPWEPGLPMVLSRGLNRRTVMLREFDPAAGDFGAFAAAEWASTGCEDLAFVNGSFGQPGVLIVCGAVGAETIYYTELGGVPSWQHNPDYGGTLGNMARVDAHVGGDYALAISFSGRRVNRFEDGVFNYWLDAPHFSTQGIWAINFQQEGQRALIVGRTASSPTRGTVIEYRHDAYHCDGLDCDLTDVSIPNFGDAPYNADSSTYLFGSAFRPGCDGGLVVGGHSDWQGSRGMIIRFAIEGARACP